LVDATSDAVCLPDAGVFQRVAIFLYALQALLKVAHNLLGTHDPDDGAAAGGIDPELAAGHGSYDRLALLGYGMHAADHVIRRRAELARLVGLRRSVELPQPWPDCLVGARL